MRISQCLNLEFYNYETSLFVYVRHAHRKQQAEALSLHSTIAEFSRLRANMGRSRIIRSDACEAAASPRRSSTGELARGNVCHLLSRFYSVQPACQLPPIQYTRGAYHTARFSFVTEMDRQQVACSNGRWQ